VKFLPLPLRVGSEPAVPRPRKSRVRRTGRVRLATGVASISVSRLIAERSDVMYQRCGSALRLSAMVCTEVSYGAI
jgi:hypothetical protein